MQHGGKRDGAGRPRGPATVKSQELLIRYIEDGKKLPLDVLMDAMREYWDEKDKESAVMCAEKAAPYFHPKLASMELTGVDGKELIPDNITITLRKPDADRTP